jgi:hypothetical protein
MPDFMPDIKRGSQGLANTRNNQQPQAQFSDTGLDLRPGAIAMLVGARGSLDLIHAESDRRGETRGQTPPGAKVPHSVVKVAVRVERAAKIAESGQSSERSRKRAQSCHSTNPTSTESNAQWRFRGAAQFFLGRECAPGWPGKRERVLIAPTRDCDMCSTLRWRGQSPMEPMIRQKPMAALVAALGRKMARGVLDSRWR